MVGKSDIRITFAWRCAQVGVAAVLGVLLAVQLSQALTTAQVPQLPGLGQCIRFLLQSYSKKHGLGSVHYSLNKAEELLTAAGVERSHRADRIFIPMLSNRPEWLCQFTTTYAQNVAPDNPSDIFVFSAENEAKDSFLYNCSAVFSPSMTLHFMPLKEHWTHPQGSAADRTLWSQKRMKFATADYRQMGHWRLVFQFTLAKLLGYKYLWQLDDDSQLVLPVETNLPGWMKDNNVLIGYRAAQRDVVEVTWALPELTRTFLVAERYQPVGPLFEHTSPPGLDGLYTTKNLSNTAFDSTDNGGWDRSMLYGNCIMFGLDFWFEPLVQRYVELVTSSWYHYRFRWNEQSTIGMIWQLFVPKEQSKFLPIPSQGYMHNNKYVEAKDEHLLL